MKGENLYVPASVTCAFSLLGCERASVPHIVVVKCEPWAKELADRSAQVCEGFAVKVSAKVCVELPWGQTSERVDVCGKDECVVVKVL